VIALLVKLFVLLAIGLAYSIDRGLALVERELNAGW
jgi:hypothetical protein